MPAPHLSVIVPAFNEAARIRASLDAILAWLDGHAGGAELIVVDDGSDDGTAAVVHAAATAATVPVRVIVSARNHGKGHALKLGFAAARGRHLLFTDADLSTGIDAAPRMLAALEAGADIAIGTRKQPQATILRHQPWHREQMGRVFTLLARTLVVDVSDVTCGFKAFRHDAGRDLFAHVRLFDWSFDAEVLFLAARRRYRIVEVPVRWQDEPGTKVRLLRDSLQAFLGLLRIRANAWRGAYAAPAPAAASHELPAARGSAASAPLR
jgi:glycosyltransferase involved in cell wall biosynthesis